MKEGYILKDVAISVPVTVHCTNGKRVSGRIASKNEDTCVIETPSMELLVIPYECVDHFDWHAEAPGAQGSTTRNDILDKAKSIINGERQGTYGTAEDSFAVISQLWTAYLGKDLSSADVANMMILMKVARNASGVYKDDNWIDICGYAALGGEIQAKYNDK